MFKPTRIFLVKTALLSACGRAFGNVLLNDLVLTSAALHAGSDKNGGPNYGGAGDDEAGDGGE